METNKLRQQHVRAVIQLTVNKQKESGFQCDFSYTLSGLLGG